MLEIVSIMKAGMKKESVSHKLKRIGALLLAILLLTGAFPLQALATQDTAELQEHAATQTPFPDQEAETQTEPLTEDLPAPMQYRLLRHAGLRRHRGHIAL